MDSLGAYLQKFQKLTPHSRTVQEACAKVIADELGCDVAPEQLRVHDDTVQLMVSPALKQAVFLRRTTLLQRMNEELHQTGKSVRHIT
jgi:hypothetical protein